MPFGRRARSVDPMPADPAFRSGTAVGARPGGRRVRRPARHLAGVLTAAPGLILCLALGGCATGGVPADRDAERRATLERWSRCIERQSDVATLSDVRSRLEHGCEGHRRDVLRAFPPRMASRLERLMDERTSVLLRTRAGEHDALREPGDSMLRGVIEALSTS